MKILSIIPARYASSRFPGKPLVKIQGKPMIQWVYEQAKKAKSLSEVIVATDDERIFEAVEGFGGKVVMTSKNHQSGTDRCCEAAKQTMPDADVIINIQGDEPLIDPQAIDLLASAFEKKNVEIATLAKLFKSKELLFDINKPKVICDKNGFAIYFSRAVLPHFKSLDEDLWFDNYPYLHHIGLYAYRFDTLKRITELPVSVLEKAESLEQLRWLENGLKIKVLQTKDYDSVAVDTPEDLALVERILSSSLPGA